MTCTQTLASLPFATSTLGSVISRRAQYGSASRCSLPGAAAAPVNCTSPSMTVAPTAKATTAPSWVLTPVAADSVAAGAAVASGAHVSADPPSVYATTLAVGPFGGGGIAPGARRAGSRGTVSGSDRPFRPAAT